MLATWGIKYLPIQLDRAGLNPFKDAFGIASLVRTFRKLKPDVFFGYTIKPVAYGMIAARIAGVPRRTAMLTGLGYAFTEGRENSVVGRIAKALLKTALSNSHQTIFQNPDDLKFMRSIRVLEPDANVGLVNGSGVDLAYYSAKPLPDGPIVFLMIARLLRDKGVVEYVEAARLMKARHPSARFLLAGPIDPNPAAIKSTEVEAWVRDGIIEYLGTLHDVRPALAQCHVYVLPSYREGTPRTVLEAMAIGRPIITTDAPGCRETVIQGKNGFLVPIRDAHAISACMEQFVTHPELVLELSRESIEIVRDKFEASSIARATASLILNSSSHDQSLR